VKSASELLWNLSERFKPNPFVDPPSIDPELSGDVRRRPALAKASCTRANNL